MSVIAFLPMGDYHETDWYHVSMARGSEVKQVKDFIDFRNAWFLWVDEERWKCDT